MDPIVEKHYKSNYNKIYYHGKLGFFEKWTHLSLERTQNTFPRILDVGGGDGQHLIYVKDNFEEYTIVDLMDHSNSLNSGITQFKRNKIRFIQSNIETLPLESDYFDRIICTCVLHHVQDAKAALLEMRRVVKDGGNVSIYLPHDPGMFYRWIRHFVAHRKLKKTTNNSMSGIKYLWALEHRNHYLGLQIIIKEIFKNDSIKIVRSPIRIASWNFNLFSTIQIKVSKS